MESLNNKTTAKSIILFFIAFICLNANKAIGQQANFSGKWSISESKSDFAGQPKATMYQGLEVNQTKDSLIVKGTRFPAEGQDFKTSTTNAYAMSGSKTESSTATKITTSTLSWSADKKSLTRNSTYSAVESPDQELYHSKEIWSLSADAKILTLTRTFSLESGDVTVKAVYEKQ